MCLATHIDLPHGIRHPSAVEVEPFSSVAGDETETGEHDRESRQPARQAVRRFRQQRLCCRHSTRAYVRSGRMSIRKRAGLSSPLVVFSESREHFVDGIDGLVKDKAESRVTNATQGFHPFRTQAAGRRRQAHHTTRSP